MKLRIKELLRQINFGSNHSQNESNKTQALAMPLGMRKWMLWLGGIVAFLGLTLGFDLIGEALEDVVTVIFEFAQSNLESLYKKVFKMDLRHAQIATAYTGFVVFIALAYAVIRNFSVVLQEAYQLYKSEREKAKEIAIKTRECAITWWASLDGFNKCFACIAGVVLAVPIVYIACIAIGNTIAELL